MMLRSRGRGDSVAWLLTAYFCVACYVVFGLDYATYLESGRFESGRFEIGASTSGSVLLWLSLPGVVMAAIALAARPRRLTSLLLTIAIGLVFAYGAGSALIDMLRG